MNLFDTLIGWMLGILMVLCFGLILLSPFAIAGSAKEKRNFMEQCQADHKEYECVAMWRAGIAKMRRQISNVANSQAVANLDQEAMQ